MTIRMGSIRRARCDFQSAPDDKRSPNVEGGLDPIGDQDVCVTEQTTENFCHRKNRVHDHAKERDTRTCLPGRRVYPAINAAGLQILRGGLRMLRQCHR